MNKKRLPILLAALALVVSTLACALGGEPTLANVRTALDEDGAQPSAVFAATDTVYVVGDLSNGVVGNVITSKWYAVEVVDTEPNFLIDEADISVTEDSFNGTIYFFFPPPIDGQWPAGRYSVEVYFNGVLNSTVEFTIQ